MAIPGSAPASSLFMFSLDGYMLYGISLDGYIGRVKFFFLGQRSLSPARTAQAAQSWPDRLVRPLRHAHFPRFSYLRE